MSRRGIPKVLKESRSYRCNYCFRFVGVHECGNWPAPCVFDIAIVQIAVICLASMSVLQFLTCAPGLLWLLFPARISLPRLFFFPSRLYLYPSLLLAAPHLKMKLLNDCN